MKLFYFYDCPRTGGTSAKRWFKNNDGVKRLHFGEGTGWHHVTFQGKDEVQKLAPNEPIWFFTLLRDPVEHTISLYAKIRVHKHAYRDKLSKLTFHDWINGSFEEDYNSCPDPWGFSMVRFFDPSTKDLNQAIKNVESLDFVGFTENLEKDMDLMFAKAGVSKKFGNIRTNQGKKNFHVSDQNRDKIKEIRKLDYDLVNYFRKERGLKIYA